MICKVIFLLFLLHDVSHCLRLMQVVCLLELLSLDDLLAISKSQVDWLSDPSRWLSEKASQIAYSLNLSIEAHLVILVGDLVLVFQEPVD